MFLSDSTAVYTLSKFKKKCFSYQYSSIHLRYKKKFLYYSCKLLWYTINIKTEILVLLFQNFANCSELLYNYNTKIFFPVDTHTTHSQLLLFFASMISLFTKHDFFVDSNECHLTYKKLLLNNRLTFRLEKLKKKSIKLNNEKKI